MPPTNSPPDMRLRRARQGHWEQAGTPDECGKCKNIAPLNILWICQACNFREKISTLTVIAEPWALKEVRREYGHSGESSPSDQEFKARKSEKDEEALAKMISYEEFERRVAHDTGIVL